MDMMAAASETNLKELKFGSCATAQIVELELSSAARQLREIRSQNQLCKIDGCNIMLSGAMCSSAWASTMHTALSQLT